MATEKKYLDLTGLSLYNEKIKDWVSKNFNNYEYDDTALAGRVSDLETLTSDYSTVKSNAAAGKTAADAWTIFLTDSTFPQSQTPKLKDLVTSDEFITKLAKKVDRVDGMGLSQNSYTNDEKAKLEGIATGAQVNVIESIKVNNTSLTVTDKAVNIDLSSYDTIASVDGKLANKADVSSVYTKTEIDTKVSDINTELTKKADSATTLAGYGIKDAYTKTEVDSAVKLAKDQILGIVDDETLSGAYDTLQEVADWIANDTSGAAAMQNDITNLKNGKADKAESLAGYGIKDAYTKTEVDGIKTNLQAYADRAEADAIQSSKDYVDGLNIATTYATKNELTAGLAGKTSMSVETVDGEDRVVFSQGSGDDEIKVSPITEAEINALFE